MFFWSADFQIAVVALTKRFDRKRSIWGLSSRPHRPRTQSPDHISTPPFLCSSSLYTGPPPPTKPQMYSMCWTIIYLASFTNVAALCVRLPWSPLLVSLPEDRRAASLAFSRSMNGLFFNNKPPPSCQITA